MSVSDFKKEENILFLGNSIDLYFFHCVLCEPTPAIVRLRRTPFGPSSWPRAGEVGGSVVKYNDKYIESC